MSNEERFEDSILDPLQEKRKRRLDAVINLLRKEREIGINRFCGQISILYGIRRETLKEYLKDLEDFGLVEITEGTIRWLGDEPEEEELP